jgi:hypothetical protein
MGKSLAGSTGADDRPDRYDSDHQYGSADFAQVNQCSCNEDKCQDQQQYPNGSRCRGMELVCGNEVGLHILEFDGSSGGFLGVMSGCKHVKGLPAFYLT